jgi:hypothetical protein
MGWVDPETDGIRRRLDQAVEAIEKTCRTATGESAP